MQLYKFVDLDLNSVKDYYAQVKHVNLNNVLELEKSIKLKKLHKYMYMLAINELV